MHLSYWRLVAMGVLAFATPACASATERDTEGATDALGDDTNADTTPRPTTAPATTDDVRSTTRYDTTGEGLRLSVHTTLGIPEAAVVDDPEHALLVKDEYVTSYDSKRKGPRWTSWELTNEWLGTADRSPRFRHDDETTLPQPTSSDFSLSGYQQGHVCPSADRTKSDAVNQATFVFTNVVPQTAASNLGTWKTLENEERSLVAEGHHVFVIAGPLYEAEKTIGAGVAVPTSLFKVVIALRSANEHPTAAEVSAVTPIIAVDIPNTNDVAGNYSLYQTTITAIEAKTGFHLLSDVAPAVHDALATAPQLAN